MTLRAVGERAGVSRGAPYRHYAGKADLLQALAVKNLHDMASAIRRAAADGDDPDAAARLRRGCAAYVRHALEQPHHYQLIFGDTPIADPVPEVEAAADDAMDAVREVVEQAQGAGAFRPGPARELATVVWVMLHGMAQLQITGHFHEPRTIDGGERLEELLELGLASVSGR